MANEIWVSVKNDNGRVRKKKYAEKKIVFETNSYYRVLFIEKMCLVVVSIQRARRSTTK
jgi:hypothetical protein